MRRRFATAVMGLGLLALAGCVSTLDSLWEGEARKNCDRESGQQQRSDCQDRVDEEMRERR
jgi:hypothetical protein